MKLYYSSGACSLSPHIVLREAGLPFDLEQVDLKTKKTKSGKDYNAIAEKSAVPLLELADGEFLSEGVAIVQYIADLAPQAKLAPANGTIERVRLQEWLNYISTEMHKTFGPFFRADTFGPGAIEFLRGKLTKNFDYLSGKLQDKQYLMGDQFTVADAYLFTVLNWTNWVKIDLSPWPVLVAYQERVAARPAVQAALKEEGLLDTKAA
jgi:glutathione S-transferase